MHFYCFYCDIKTILMNLIPYDIFGEIAKYLEPVDINIWAFTSKSYMAQLLNDNIWINITNGIRDKKFHNIRSKLSNSREYNKYLEYKKLLGNLNKLNIIFNYNRNYDIYYERCIIHNNKKIEITCIPHEIGTLINLQYLHITSNKISNIPVEIGDLINLRKLWLNSKYITNIPAEIGKLVNLRELHLNRCKITSIPTEIGKLVKLRKLYLDHNNIINIPVEIGQLTKLQFLDLQYNKIREIPEELYALTNLKYLGINNNKICWIGDTICRLVSLEDLYVHDNELLCLPYCLHNMANLSCVSNDLYDFSISNITFAKQMES